VEKVAVVFSSPGFVLNGEEVEIGPIASTDVLVASKMLQNKTAQAVLCVGGNKIGEPIYGSMAEALADYIFVNGEADFLQTICSGRSNKTIDNILLDLADLAGSFRPKELVLVGTRMFLFRASLTLRIAMSVGKIRRTKVSFCLTPNLYPLKYRVVEYPLLAATLLDPLGKGWFWRWVSRRRDAQRTTQAKARLEAMSAVVT